MDVLADARTKAGNAFAQFMLACVYVDSRGWRTPTYCDNPRIALVGELSRFGYDGPDKTKVTSILVGDLDIAPERKDTIEISESVSALHCGTYRILTLLQNDGVEAFVIVTKE